MVQYPHITPQLTHKIFNKHLHLELNNREYIYSFLDDTKMSNIDCIWKTIQNNHKYISVIFYKSPFKQIREAGTKLRKSKSKEWKFSKNR
jgi:hypothetical protein